MSVLTYVYIVRVFLSIASFKEKALPKKKVLYDSMYLALVRPMITAVEPMSSR